MGKSPQPNPSEAPNFDPDTVTLVADDHFFARNLLVEMLRAIGFQVIHSAADGPKTVLAFELYHPKLLFLDIEMPEISGLEVLRRIRESDKEIFIAIVSAHSSVENVQEALKNGANGFIVKPYTYRKVVEIVRKWAASKPASSLRSGD